MEQLGLSDVSGLEDIILAEVSNQRKTNIAWFFLCEIPKRVRLTEADCRMMAARVWWGRRNGSCCSAAIKSQVPKMSKF